MTYLFVPGNRPERFDRAAAQVAAVAGGEGAVQVDGKMVDRPVALKALAILDHAAP